MKHPCIIDNVYCEYEAFKFLFCVNITFEALLCCMVIGCNFYLVQKSIFIFTFEKLKMKVNNALNVILYL
jgi:hypothetical protein